MNHSYAKYQVPPQIIFLQHYISHILSNQIKFYLKSAMYILKEKKISKKLFTRLYSITNNNKLYIWFKCIGTSQEPATCRYIPGYLAIERRILYTYCKDNLALAIFNVFFLNSANVIEFFISSRRSFYIFAPLYRNEFKP